MAKINFERISKEQLEQERNPNYKYFSIEPMIPQEKSQELLDKMYFSRRYKDGEDYIPEQAWIHAKECALIAVDEIMKLVPSVYLTDDNEVHSGHYQYWQEVKTEIEKL